MSKWLLNGEKGTHGFLYLCSRQASLGTQCHNCPGDHLVDPTRLPTAAQGRWLQRLASATYEAINTTGVHIRSCLSNSTPRLDQISRLMI